MAGQHRAPRERIPVWARVVVYVVAMVAPFVAVIHGTMDGPGATTAAIALVGALGPALATVEAAKTEQIKRATYRQGFTEARGLTDVTGPVSDHHYRSHDER